MTYASTVTKLDLNTWSKIVGINPLHFNQVAFVPSNLSPNSRCGQALLQYDWQDSDKTGREQIAQGIAEAEKLLETYLQYRLIPSWEFEEWRPAPRPNQPELFFATARDIRGAPSSLQTEWGWLRSGGVEAYSLIAANQNIVWSDTDADNYKETGTITVPGIASTVNACEIEIFYPGHSGDPAYQIRPIKVSLVAGTATITTRREYCVKESIIEDMNGVLAADPSADGDFLSMVDVYRHYNDPSTQATLMWIPNSLCANCGSTGCASCAYTVQSACLILMSDRRNSIVGYQPGDWNTTTLQFDSACMNVDYGPDLVKLFYYGGWQADKGCPRQMDPDWARAVAYLSLTFIDRPTCGCMSATWERWREDLAYTSGGDQTSHYQATQRQLDNPFGTMRGAVYAWNRVNDLGAARTLATALV